MYARAVEVLERCKEIAGHVEGAVVSDFQGSCEIDELPCAAGVDSPVQIQNAQNNAIGAELLCRGDVVLHDLKFVVGIAEIAAARSNHDVKRDGNRPARNADRPAAGCNAPAGEIAAKLHTMRSAALGRHRGFNGIGAYFKEDIFAA